MGVVYTVESIKIVRRWNGEVLKISQAKYYENMYLILSSQTSLPITPTTSHIGQQCTWNMLIASQEMLRF